jgi:hypothetical protein
MMSSFPLLIVELVCLNRLFDFLFLGLSIDPSILRLPSFNFLSRVFSLDRFA